jgi:hypothetical protein
VEMLRIKHKFGNYSLEMDMSIQCQNKAVLDVLEIYNDIPSPEDRKKMTVSPGV